MSFKEIFLSDDYAKIEKKYLSYLKGISDSGSLADQLVYATNEIAAG